MRGLSLLLLAGASAARASTLSGPMILQVLDDKAIYQAGAAARVTVTLRNATGSAWSGHVDVAMCSRGNLVGTVQSETVASLAPSAQTVLAPISLSIPAGEDVHGYALAIDALTSSDGGTAACTGTGTTSSSPTDLASGALEIAASPLEDPIYAWFDANALAGTAASTVVDNLGQYHVNMLQGYDVAWRHDEPYSPAATWPNLAGITVTGANLTSYLTAAHGYGMDVFLYQLWNGGWTDYQTADPAVTLSMGLFPPAAGGGAPCAGSTCTAAEQLTDGGGWSAFVPPWSTDHLVEFNPGNALWATHLFGQWNAFLAAYSFDGIQIDTLGDPGTVYDYRGRSVNLGDDLSAFANAAAAAIGRPVLLNNVSNWNQQDVDISMRSPAHYTEIHPEFGNVPGYPDVNGLVGQTRQWNSGPLVVPAYLQQVYSGALPISDAVAGDSVTPCTPGGATTCTFSDPGLELADSMFAISGATHFELGDVDKLASNIYLPGPMLSLDAAGQEWLADYYNVLVGQRDVLRRGVTDSLEIVSVTTSTGTSVGTSVGAAGGVYYLPKTKSGYGLVLHLFNEVGLATNRIDDPDAKDHPTPQTNLQVTAEIFGGGTPGRLLLVSPDIAHGVPQVLSYTLNSTPDASGKPTITFTVPSLTNWDMIELEGAYLTGGYDYRTGSSAYIRGSNYVWASRGAGASNTNMVQGCCTRMVHYEAVDFGAGGATTLTANLLSANGGRIEWFLGTQDDHGNSVPGPLLASTFAPPTGTSSSFVTQTVPLLSSPTGVQDIWVEVPDQDVTLVSFQP